MEGLKVLREELLLPLEGVQRGGLFVPVAGFPALHCLGGVGVVVNVAFLVAVLAGLQIRVAAGFPATPFRAAAGAFTFRSAAVAVFRPAAASAVRAFRAGCRGMSGGAALVFSAG